MKFGCLTRVTIAVTGALLFGCSRPDFSLSQTQFRGPGEVWSLALNNDLTFQIDRASSLQFTAADLTLKGIYNRLPTGFDYLLVEKATSPTGALTPTALGTGLTAIEVPNVALLMIPPDGVGPAIPLLVSGGCPTNSFDANYVVISQSVACSDPTSLTCNWFGVFRYVPGAVSGIPGFPSIYGFDAGALAPKTYNPAACTSGTIETDGARFFLSTYGAAVVQTVTGSATTNQNALALPATALTGELLAGDYVGLYYRKSTNKTVPVKLTLDTQARATGGTTVADVMLGTAGDFGFQWQLGSLDQPLAGMARATLTTTNGATTASADLRCVASVGLTSQKNIIECAGEEPGTPNSLATLVLTSK